MSNFAPARHRSRSSSRDRALPWESNGGDSLDFEDPKPRRKTPRSRSASREREPSPESENDEVDVKPAPASNRRGRSRERRENRATYSRSPSRSRTRSPSVSRHSEADEELPIEEPEDDDDDHDDHDEEDHDDDNHHSNHDEDNREDVRDTKHDYRAAAAYDENDEVIVAVVPDDEKAPGPSERCRNPDLSLDKIGPHGFRTLMQLYDDDEYVVASMKSIGLESIVDIEQLREEDLGTVLRIAGLEEDEEKVIRERLVKIITSVDHGPLVRALKRATSLSEVVFGSSTVLAALKARGIESLPQLLNMDERQINAVNITDVLVRRRVMDYCAFKGNKVRRPKRPSNAPPASSSSSRQRRSRNKSTDMPPAAGNRPLTDSELSEANALVKLLESGKADTHTIRRAKRLLRLTQNVTEANRSVLDVLELYVDDEAPEMEDDEKAGGTTDSTFNRLASPKQYSQAAQRVRGMSRERSIERERERSRSRERERERSRSRSRSRSTSRERRPERNAEELGMGFADSVTSRLYTTKKKVQGLTTKELQDLEEIRRAKEEKRRKSQSRERERSIDDITARLAKPKERYKGPSREEQQLEEIAKDHPLAAPSRRRDAPAPDSEESGQTSMRRSRSRGASRKDGLVANDKASALREKQKTLREQLLNLGNISLESCSSQSVSERKYVKIARAATFAAKVTRIRNEDQAQDASFKAVAGLGAGAEQSSVSFEHMSFPNCYLVHVGDRIKLQKGQPGREWRRSAGWRVCPGMTGEADSVSLESVSRPGFFIHEEVNTLFLHKEEKGASDLFKRCCTFRVLPMLWRGGGADSEEEEEVDKSDAEASDY